MRDIRLHGALADEFGGQHSFEVDSLSEVIDALRANYPGFIAAIREGFYRIVMGKSPRSKDRTELSEAEIVGFRLDDRPIHIIPVVGGRKRGGIGKIIAGIALIGLAFIPGMAPIMGTTLFGTTTTVGAMVGNLGLSMILTGVANLISPSQDAGDDKKSFTMSGPTSNLKEGNIVPIPYGEVISGGYVVAATLRIDGTNGDKGIPPSVANNPNLGAGGSMGMFAGLGINTPPING